MIEKILFVIFILALSLVSSLTDYNKTELTNFHDELPITKQEKDASEPITHVVSEKNAQLQSQIAEITQSRNQLKAQVAKLNKLHEQVDELIQFRLELQKKNDNLTKSLDAAAAEAEAARHTIDKLTLSRDAAIAEARAAKLEIDELTNKLEAKTEEIRGLQEQLKQVQGVVAELQSTLKP